jgi:hypothetical protein
MAAFWLVPKGHQMLFMPIDVDREAPVVIGDALGIVETGKEHFLIGIQFKELCDKFWKRKLRQRITQVRDADRDIEITSSNSQIGRPNIF